MPDDSPRPTPARWRTVGFLVLLVATVSWNGLLVAVPWLAGHGHDGRSVVALSAGVYLTAGVVCHQQPERSFHLWGVQMPVCTRCAGLYLGAAIGALVCIPRRRGSGRLWLSPERWAGPGEAATSARWVVGVAAVPTVVTVVGEWSGVFDETAWWRALAGVALGTAVAWVVSLVIRGELE